MKRFHGVAFALATFSAITCAPAADVTLAVTNSWQRPTWSGQVELRVGNYRGLTKGVRLEKRCHIVVPAGTLIEGGGFNGDRDCIWNVDRSLFRKVEVSCNCGSRFQAKDSAFYDCNFKKGGGWSVDLWSSRWDFENCVVAKQFLPSRCRVKDYSVRAIGCTFYDIKLPEVEFKDDPSKQAQSKELRFEHCRFINCELTESALAATIDCVFDNCKFYTTDQTDWSHAGKRVAVNAFIVPAKAKHPESYATGLLEVHFQSATDAQAAGASLKVTRTDTTLTYAAVAEKGVMMQLGDMASLAGNARAVVVITNLPHDLMPTQGKLIEGVERNTGKGRITDMPEQLRGRDYVTIERGDYRKPGQGYSFSVNVECAIYLSVFQRADAKLPPDWVKTPYHLSHTDTGQSFTDTIYLKVVRPGEVQIPVHSGKDGDKWGLPHLAIVDSDLNTARQLLAQAAERKKPVKGVYIVEQEGQAGWAQFTYDNVYRFDITNDCTIAIVTVEAIKPTESSQGEIRLRIGNRKDVIGAWDKDDFPSDNLLRFDASQYIRQPGHYAVEMAYTRGEHGLHTSSVTIDTRPSAVRPTPRKESAPKPAPVAVSAKPGAAQSFARSQSTIKGLFIVQTAIGQRVGGAQDIIATVEETTSRSQVGCSFVGTVARDTLISLEEAERLLRVRYPVWQSGRRVRFSFAEKYTRQSGGSAGAAYSLLLLSLLDGMAIDPDFAITGDVTVDGKIRKVGAVAEKIRGAVLEKCKMVALPAVNKESLADLAVLYGPAMLWSAQLFSVENLDQAAAVARPDRAANLAKAITQFAQLQQSLGPHATVLALRNPGVIHSLQEVLKLAPDHASAEFMLRAADGQLPNTLTLAGSLEELWSAAAPLLPLLSKVETDTEMNKKESIKIGHVPDELFKMINDRLGWLTPRLHPTAKDLRTAMTEFVAAVSALNRKSMSGTFSQKQFEAKREKVLGEITKIGADRKVLEELMH